MSPRRRKVLLGAAIVACAGVAAAWPRLQAEYYYVRIVMNPDPSESTRYFSRLENMAHTAAVSFHRAPHISYPNAEDRRRARGQRVPPGGDIMIHGLPNGMSAIGKAHVLRDWTEGCIAVTNEEIEELWRVVRNGTRIEIKP